jgi:predicted nuclease of predicted toxin-antitoxin system
VKLLLDEHVSPAIAEQLQARGYDVLPVAERGAADAAHLRRRPDEELLRLAYREGRALVTENVGDFIVIHGAFLARGEPHAGIVFTSRRRFPRHAGGIGRLVAALASLLDRHTGALDTDIVWLQTEADVN